MAMMPSEPGRFSITTGWSQRLESCMAEHARADVLRTARPLADDEANGALRPGLSLCCRRGDNKQAREGGGSDGTTCRHETLARTAGRRLKSRGQSRLRATP